MDNKRLGIILLLAWMVLLIFLLLTPPSLLMGIMGLVKIGGLELGRIPYEKVDKLGHIILFAIGTIIAFKILTLKKVFALMLTLSLLTECLQMLSPQRTLSLLDIYANTVGVTLGIAVAIWMPLLKKTWFDKLIKMNT